MNLNTTIKQNPVACFIVLTLALSFATFLLPVTGQGDLIALLFVLAAIPTVVAFTLVALMAGRHGAFAFLRQSFYWRTPLHWYVIAIVIGFVIQVGSSVLALATGRIATLALAAPNPLLIVLILWALLEEIGWRGFALARLCDRYAPFTATLLVGIPWALIHFGLAFFILPNIPPVIEGLAVLAFTVPHSWIFIKSGRNVLVTTVLHWSINVSGSIAGPGHTLPEAEALTFLLVSACLVAVLILMIEWRLWFARPVETTAGEPVPAAMLF